MIRPAEEGSRVFSSSPLMLQKLCKAYPSSCICDYLPFSYHTQVAAYLQSTFDTLKILRFFDS